MGLGDLFVADRLIAYFELQEIGIFLCLGRVELRGFLLLLESAADCSPLVVRLGMGSRTFPLNASRGMN